MNHRTRSCAEPRDGWHHRLEDENVVVGLSDAIGDDRAVVQVDDCAQVCLFPGTIFKLGDVGAPFLVRSGRAELSATCCGVDFLCFFRFRRMTDWIPWICIKR